MYKNILLLLLFFCSIAVLGQKKAKFSAQQIHQDMALLKKNFEQLHPAMYYYTSQESYQHLYDSLYNSVNDSITYFEAFHKIAPLVIAIKDGHTSVSNAKNTYGKTPPFIPFYLKKVNTDYYILYNCSNDSTILRGSKIIAIDKMPIDEINKKIGTLVSRDNNNQSSVNYYTNQAFNVFYMKYFGKKDSILLDYQPYGEDTVISKIVKCIPIKQINKNLKSRYKWAIRSNLSLKLVDTVQRVAILNITSFSASGKFLDLGNWKFKRLIHKQFANINKSNIKHLIIDVRGNGGGFIPNISRLMKYLSPSPFDITDSIKFRARAFKKIARPIWLGLPPLALKLIFPKQENGWYYRVSKNKKKFKPNEKLGYRGNLYFLMNGGSYSATTFTLALAKDLGIGTFIGEQPGGANWGSFAVNWYDYKLPNTKIRIHQPLFKITHNLPNNRCKTEFLEPDYLLGKPLSDFGNKHDNYIDFTLDLIGK